MQQVNLWGDIWSRAFLCNLSDKKVGGTELFTDADLTKAITLVNSIIKDISTDVPIAIGSYNGELMRSIPSAISNSDILIELTVTSPILIELLKIGGGKMHLCGGAVLTAIINTSGHNHHHYNDFDLFFSCTEEEADDILEKCLAIMPKIGTDHFRSQRVITCMFVDGIRRVKVQFIKKLYQSKDRILLGFDMPGCQYGYNPIDGLFVTLPGMLSFITGYYPADMTQRCVSYESRLMKYMEKGFKIMLPGLGGEAADFANKKCMFNLTETNGVYHMYSEEGNVFFVSDYEDERFNINTLTKYSPVFEFASQTCEGILELNDEVVKNTMMNLAGYPMPQIDRLSKSAKQFLGKDRLTQFVTARVVNENEDEAKRIWSEAQAIAIQKAKDLAASLNGDLRWKKDDLGSRDFGKFNPVPPDHNEWHGGRYIPVIVGLQHDRFQAWMDCRKNVERLVAIPLDILNIISAYWFRAETRLATRYLDRLIGKDRDGDKLKDEDY